MRVDLSNRELERYSRQVLLQAIGFDGQLKIMASHLDVRGEAWAAELALAYLGAAGADVQDDRQKVGEDKILVVRSASHMWAMDVLQEEPMADRIVRLGQLCTRILLDLAQGD